jgi:hypothetical protein
MKPTFVSTNPGAPPPPLGDDAMSGILTEFAEPRPLDCSAAVGAPLREESEEGEDEEDEDEDQVEGDGNSEGYSE